MHHIDVDDGPIAYDVSGEEHDETVLLIAGTGYSGSTWSADLIARLAQKYAVITTDHRGTGRSVRESLPLYSTALFAQDISAVLRHLDRGPVHVMGHSMGGRVAQELWFADRGAVRSIAFCASGAGAERKLPVRLIGIPVGAAEQMARLGYDGYVRDKHRTAFFTPEFCAEHPEAVADLDEAFISTAPSLRDYLRHVQARQAHSRLGDLHEMAVPTLVLVGSDDTIGAVSHVDEAERLAARLPGTSYEVIPGARHGIMWENARTVADRCLAFFSHH